MTSNRPEGSNARLVSLSDEEAVQEILGTTVLDLWKVVNNLTRLRPSKRERYRVAIFGSARAQPGTFVYDEVKRAAAAFAAMGCDIVTGGGPGLMQAANEGAKDRRRAGVGRDPRRAAVRAGRESVRRAGVRARDVLHAPPSLRHRVRRVRRRARRHRHRARDADDLAAAPGPARGQRAAHPGRQDVAGLVEWAKTSMLDPRLPLASAEDLGSRAASTPRMRPSPSSAICTGNGRRGADRRRSNPEIHRSCVVLRIGSTARSASAAIVSVGFDDAPVGNTPLPNRKRLS